MCERAPDRWPHTAAILAGGSSTRMGRRKETMPLPDGRPMIGAVFDVLAAAADRVVIVGSTDALPELVHVEDLRPGLGPLGALEALLASGLDAEYLVCPCDVPRLTLAPLAALVRSSHPGPPPAPAAALMLEGEDRPRPLPARFSADALPAVRRLLDNGRRAVHALLREVHAEIIAAPAEWAAVLADVDTEDDLEATKRRSDGGKAGN